MRNFRGAYRDYVLNVDQKAWTLDGLARGDAIPMLPSELNGGYALYSVTKGLVNRITELQAAVRTRASSLGADEAVLRDAEANALLEEPSDTGAVENGQAYGSDNIRIVATDPGWCATEMGGPGAPLTPSQGADTAVRARTHIYSAQIGTRVG